MELNSVKFGFLDCYSGDTNKPWGLAEVCRRPEKTCHPSAQPSTPPFTPLCLLLCWAVRRRRNGGRWVCGWGKRCGAKSCLIAALRGLHHFHQRLCLTSLPGQHERRGWFGPSGEMTLTRKVPQTPAHTVGQTEQFTN